MKRFLFITILACSSANIALAEEVPAKEHTGSSDWVEGYKPRAHPYTMNPFYLGGWFTNWWNPWHQFNIYRPQEDLYLNDMLPSVKYGAKPSEVKPALKQKSSFGNVSGVSKFKGSSTNSYGN